MNGLNYYLNLLSNREEATLIWLSIFLIWILFKKDIRISFIRLLKSLLAKKILIILSGMLLYVFLIIISLYKIKIWDTFLIKDTTFWIFGSAFILLMNTTEAPKDEHHFRKIIFENFKLTLILEFIISIIIVLIVGAGAFYGGLVYGKSQNASSPGRFQGFNANGAQRGARQGANGGLVNGQILAQDAKSITLKLNNGGSKIIFLSDTTQIMKSTNGAVSDLTTGENLMVNGMPNSDGSITAQTIQIRPNLPQNLPPGSPAAPVAPQG